MPQLHVPLPLAIARAKRTWPESQSGALALWSKEPSLARWRELVRCSEDTRLWTSLDQLSLAWAMTNPAGIGKDCWGDELSPEFKAHLGRSIDVRPAPRGEGAYITVRSPAAAELLATMLCSRVAPPVTGLCVDWPGAQSNLEGSRMLSLLAESVGSEGIRSIQLVGSGPVSPEFWVLLAKAPKLEELSIRPHSEEENARLFTELSNCPRLRRLSVSSVEGRLAWEALSRLDDLESLELLGGRLARDGTNTLGRLTNLRALRLDVYGLNKSEAKSLRSLRKLQALSLRKNPLPATAMEHISELRQLESLDLNRTGLAPSTISAIEQLENLQSLDLGWNALDDESLTGLRRLPKLKSLHLDGTNLEGRLLEKLTHQPGLRELSVSHNSLDPCFFEGLARLPALSSLNLERSQAPSLDSTIWGNVANLEELNLGWLDLEQSQLGGLEQCRKLLSLNLFNNPRLGDSIGDTVRHLQLLNELDVSNTGLTEQGFTCLGDLTELRVLRAVESRPGLRGISALRRLSELRWLDLGRCKIESSMVSELKLPKARVLWLYQNSISEIPKDALLHMPALRELDIRGCECDPKSVEALRKSMPNVVVLM